METYQIEKDISVICIKAETFPAGIMAAHQQLHEITDNDAERKYFGISYPERPGHIIYKAAASEKYEGESVKLNCENFIIRKGNYKSIFIKDFMNNIPAIGNAFQQLLHEPNIDPGGYCLEMYEGENDVRCMVPLSSFNHSQL